MAGSGKTVSHAENDWLAAMVNDELEQGAGLDLVLSDVGQGVDYDQIELVEHRGQAEIALPEASGPYRWWSRTGRVAPRR